MREKLKINSLMYSIANPFYKAKIQITCSTPDSKIYYTLENSQPNEQSNLYSDIFEVNEGTIIKAKAYKGRIYRIKYTISINIIIYVLYSGNK